MNHCVKEEDNEVMPDKGIIVKWFELCRVEEKCSIDCPYWDNVSALECTKKLAEDVITLLKEQDEQINLLEHQVVVNKGKFNAHETLIGKALDAGHIYR